MNRCRSDPVGKIKLSTFVERGQRACGENWYESEYFRNYTLNYQFKEKTNAHYSILYCNLFLHNFLIHLQPLKIIHTKESNKMLYL